MGYVPIQTSQNERLTNCFLLEYFIFPAIFPSTYNCWLWIKFNDTNSWGMMPQQNA